MKTEITRLLGIEYPIIQGGMAWVAEYHWQQLFQMQVDLDLLEQPLHQPSG